MVPEGTLSDTLLAVVSLFGDSAAASVQIGAALDFSPVVDLGSTSLADVGAFLVVASLFAVVVAGFLATAYRLGRCATATRLTPREVTDLPPGTYWVNLRGTVAAREGVVDTASESTPVVVRRVRAWVQESVTGLRFFRADVTTSPSVDVTNSTPFALDDFETDVVFVPDESVEVMESDWNSKDECYWPEDDVPEQVVSVLHSNGLDVDDRVFEGTVFTHVLRVNEDVVRDGDRVRIVGPVTVEETPADGIRLSPRSSRIVDVIVTTASLRQILTRYLRDLAWSLVALAFFGAVTAALAFALFWA